MYTTNANSTYPKGSMGHYKNLEEKLTTLLAEAENSNGLKAWRLYQRIDTLRFQLRDYRKRPISD